MLETILIGLVGTAVGIFIGLLPAIGPFLTMLLAYPLLQTLDPFNVIMFYVTMLMAANFSGSVTGIMFGVPGETNSVVSSQVGFRLSRRGHGLYALAVTSLGSWLAALLCVALMLVTVDQFMSAAWIYSARTQVMIFGIILVMMAVSTHGVTQIAAGAILAAIGWNDLWGSKTMMGLTSLAPGLSFLPVACAVTLIPMMWRELGTGSQQAARSVPWTVPTILIRWNRHWWTWVRSTVVGWAVGLIPGIGTVIVGNSAYAVEKKLTSVASRHLIAAESANNASAISSLLPLICFGIPISLSEAILVNIMSEKHAIVGPDWLMTVMPWAWSRLDTLYLAMIASATISLVVCWRMAQSLVGALMTNQQRLFWILSTVLISVMMFSSWQNHTLMLDLITFVILLPVGLYFRRYNTQIFLLTFLLFDTMTTSLVNFIQLL